jgi:prepilin-type N-terminal cleavage/methylation domain-containing protein
VRNSRGFTLIELLIVLAIVAVLVSIAATLYRGVRARGGEAAAIAALDAINQAQFAFMQTCGDQRYAPTLASLGTPNPRGGSAYLSPDLTSGEEVVKSGYVYRMAGTPVTDGAQACTGVTPVATYQVTADPTAPGVTGERFFGTNTGRVIFESPESLTGKMPETGAPEGAKEIEAVRTR